ncbi:MAG: class II fructose-bisphosphatase [Tissierellia bacterium]|nr:class II fructose-bisphosphatase [Tissierellia bacterium]
MDRNLVMNLARVTEAAALNSAKFLGRGDKNAADQAAVDSMRRMFDTVDINGTVVIGEGEIDEAPMLYIGEQIGSGNDQALRVDIAVDPLDGTNAIAKGLPDAISVVAVAPEGNLLHAPDMYMQKLAVGPKAKGLVSIERPLEENLKILTKALDKDISDITVVMLDRERHMEYAERVRKMGSRIRFISDGDVLGAIISCFNHVAGDMLIGIGGAPEGVLAAAALKCLGGQMEGILIPRNNEEAIRCKKMGVECNHIYTIDDMVKGNEVAFAATGVSHGELLEGVNYIQKDVATTETLVLRAETGTVRFIKATHYLNKKPEYAK